MSNLATRRQVAVAEYVAAEDTSEIKHQLIDGEVFDMTGGTPEHAALVLNVGAELRRHLRGRPCRPYGSELRIGVDDLITYPDCSVVCGKLERHPEDPNTILNPTVLVEVLSDSTERYDRGDKAERYRRIPSLREYVFVSQHRPHIELLRRTQLGWVLLEAGKGERLQLESIDCQLDVSSIYEGVFETE
jgi:Uma2 family endonuclease